MSVTIGYNGDTIASLSSSGTRTLLTAGKYCEDNITVAYQESVVTLPNYRKYEGTITQDVVGAGDTKVLLVTSEEVAAHYTDSSFKVAVHFTPDPEVPYAILQVTGYNTAMQEPYRATSGVDSMQYTYREGSSVGSFSTMTITLPVSSSSSDGYVGRIQCDAQGHIYVYSGSNNYGVRKGNFVVEITW